MKNFQFSARYSLVKSASLLSILLLLISVNIFGQKDSADKARSVRYISSAPLSAAPKARLLSKSTGIRFVKRGGVANSVTSKELAPTDFKAERKAFELINLKRSDKGLDPLQWNEEATRLARMHSENMAKHDFFSHTGLNGRSVDQRATDFGVDTWRSIGENIAFCKGFSNPASFVVERWMISDGHRRNLLSTSWRESGVGMAKTKEGKYFFTQIFIVN